MYDVGIYPLFLIFENKEYWTWYWKNKCSDEVEENSKNPGTVMSSEASEDPTLISVRLWNFKDDGS